MKKREILTLIIVIIIILSTYLLNKNMKAISELINKTFFTIKKKETDPFKKQKIAVLLKFESNQWSHYN